MKVFHLHTGLRLIFNNSEYSIIRIANEICQLEKQSDLSLLSKTKKELIDLLTSGQVSLTDSIIPQTATPNTKNLKVLSDDEHDNAHRKLCYIQQFHQNKNTPYFDVKEFITKISMELNDTSPPSEITLNRWWRKWINANQDISVLVDRTSGSKASKTFKGKVLEIFHQSVKEVFLTPERHSKQSTYDNFIYQLHQYNAKNSPQLTIPSRSSVYRMIDNLDKYTVTEARYGKKEAEQQYRVAGKGPVTKFILERAEIDHTPLDVIVIDDHTDLAIGRPYLTAILDAHSRLPLALEIGFEPPSELSVIRAIKQAIWPKTKLLNNLENIENTWPSFGIPMFLVCDNGLEFHSKQLRRVCEELNIELMFCPKHTPQYKGRVERFLGTLNRQVSQRIKGTTFSNIAERNEYDSTNNASITLANLKNIIYMWLVDVYSQSIHSSLNATPIDVWLKGLTHIEPRLPADRESFEILCCKEYERKISHNGIIFKRLFYNSESLKMLRVFQGNKSKVRFRVNYENLSSIYVYNPIDNLFISIPCTTPDYADGLTLLQHEMVLKEHRSQFVQHGETISLLTAKEKVRTSIENLSKDKRIKKKSAAARLGKINTKPTIKNRNQVNLQPEAMILEDIPDFQTTDIKGTGNA